MSEQLTQSDFYHLVDEPDVPKPEEKKPENPLKYTQTKLPEPPPKPTPVPPVPAEDASLEDALDRGGHASRRIEEQLKQRKLT